MRILAIETSCDDTAVSMVEALAGNRFRSRSHVLYSQVATHRRYGGVVPEVAAREHAAMIIPTLSAAFAKARVTRGDVDLIAVTRGPGLITSLRVGVETARTLVALWRKPLVAVNHIEGHLASCWPITGFRGVKTSAVAPRFPGLALVVSGGHTELIHILAPTRYRLLGRTRDDAAGEAFDKVAKLLRLPYPGGPALARAATRGNPKAFDFPRPMIASRNLDFSFAGLKTAVRYAIHGKHSTRSTLADAAASFQQAAVDVLVAKTRSAAARFRPATVLVAGGVAANALLRRTLARAFPSGTRPRLIVAPIPLCTDNATMIAMAAAFRARQQRFTDWKRLTADPNWELV